MPALKEIYGLYFDPATGRAYRRDDTTGELVGSEFTFEHATWTGPFSLHFSWPWLNPLLFATAETTQKVFSACYAHLPRIQSLTGARMELRVNDEIKVLGPFTRTPERAIDLVADGYVAEHFNAGLLAASILRQGARQAMESWLAEVQRVIHGPRVELPF